jgi:serine/threonine protein kinase
MELKHQIFAAYKMERKLGKGGMASVYKASHLDTGQEVALKILHEQFSDDAYIRKRLEHEAAIAAELKHPHIVPVWEYGEFEHRPYLVMPYMEGGSLAEWFTSPRALKHEASLKILGCIAQALDYAHQDGVIHRDVKLENILLSKKNVPAISDFGIAQATNTTRITRTGQVLGTPQYLAPEHFTGDGDADLDHRTDLYSFGVMAYLLLTGFFPFTGRDGLAVIVKQRDHAVPPPSLVNRALPKALDAIFERALAKKPEDRLSSALDLVHSLDAAFYNVPSIATTIFLNSPNPVSTVQIALHNVPHEMIGGDTVMMSSDTAMIPAVTIVDSESDIRVPAKSRKIWPFVSFGLLVACLGLGLFTVGMNAFFGRNGDFSEMILSNGLKVNEEVTATETPTNTETSTATQTPSITPTFTATSTGTVTPTYTFTPTRRVFASATPFPSASATLVSGGSFGTGVVQATRRATTRPLPTRTRTFTPVPTSTRTLTAVPTDIPTLIPSDTATPVPPTAIPPTDVPPTNPPPPTDVPPTDIPPTDPPPPTDIPPTDVPPTDPPPPTDEVQSVELTQEP